MFRKKLQRFMIGTVVAGLLCSQIIGASAQSSTNEEPAGSNNIYLPVVTDGSQPEDQNVQNEQTLTDPGQFSVREEPQDMNRDNSISAAAIDWDAATLTVQDRLGIGTTTPGFKLDVTDRIRLRQGASGTAGMWLFQSGPNSDRAFVGMASDNLVGLWGSAMRKWGLLMNTTTGNIGIGTTTPNHLLSVIGGPAWTTARWGGSMELANGTAIGWKANASNQRFGFGHTNGGFYIFRTASELGTTTSAASYDLVIGDSGKVGVGTQTPQDHMDITGSGDQGINIRSSDTQGSQTRLLAVTSNGKVESQMQFRNEFHFGEMAHLQGTPVMSLLGNGNVGIGTGSPTAKLDVAGTTRTKALQITGGADLAEPFAIAGAESIEPGNVVAIDPENPGQMRLSDKAYDHMVAGVVSGARDIQPGLILQQEGTVAVGSHPVALSGRVYVWADTTNGAIQPGDLLTTSTTPGHAMKVTDSAQAQGAVLGKAMGRLESSTGLVLMLVTLQ